ncbi:MAG TPA: hypothetical protein PL033_12175 [Candidatus Brocadiia bacterium]|nr:hypothetical protein [Candidatus Brocadiia bacterium]
MPVRFRCKECGAKLEVPSSHFGRKAFCTSCGKPIQVPQPVLHHCDTCRKNFVLNGKQEGRQCRCGGKLSAKQIFIKRDPSEVSRILSVDELERELGKPPDAKE